MLHDFLDLGAEFIDEVIAYLKDQFVMHLQRHVDAVLRQSLDIGIDLNHGLFNDVGSTTLHWGINCRTLGCALAHAGTIDALDKDAVAQQGGDVAVLLSLSNDLVHHGFDARVLIKVALNVVLGISVAHAGLLRETMGTHAVHQSKVGGLSMFTFIVSDIRDVLA